MQVNHPDNFTLVKQYSSYRGIIPAPNGFHSKGITLDNTKWQHLSPTVGVWFGCSTLLDKDNRVIIRTVLDKSQVLDYVEANITKSSELIQFSYRFPSLSCKYLVFEDGLQVMKRFQLEFGDHSQFIQVILRLKQMKCFVKEVFQRNLGTSLQVNIPNSIFSGPKYSNTFPEHYNIEENDTQYQLCNVGGQIYKNTGQTTVPHPIPGDFYSNKNVGHHRSVTNPVSNVSRNMVDSNYHISGVHNADVLHNIELEQNLQQTKDNYIEQQLAENTIVNYLSQNNSFQHAKEMGLEKSYREITDDIPQRMFSEYICPAINNSDDKHPTSLPIVQKCPVKTESRDILVEIECDVEDNSSQKNNGKNVQPDCCLQPGSGANETYNRNNGVTSDTSNQQLPQIIQQDSSTEEDRIVRPLSEKKQKTLKKNSNKKERAKISRKTLSSKLKDKTFMKWVCRFKMDMFYINF